MRAFRKNHRLYICVLISVLGASACSGKDGGGVGAGLVCSLLASSVDSQSLTVGFGEDFIETIRSSLELQDENDSAVNSSIQSAINDTLELASLSSALSVSKVETVASSDTDDGVRFLEFDGSLAFGINFLSTVLKDDTFKEGLNDSLGLTATDPFDFIEDSFQVYPTGQISQNLQELSSNQWAYTQTDFTQAKAIADELTDVKDQVVVAVIDTGVATSHPALTDNIYRVNGEIVGYDFANDDADADDDQGHGTHCAGIIAAKNVGSDGMIGVAEALAPGKIKIMPIKVLGGDGSGSTANINKGIRWALSNGADVISMSLGGGVEFSDLISSNGAESSIIRDAVQQGKILIVAAGNEDCPLGGECTQSTLFVLSKTIDEYTVLPCSYNGTICVGASDPDATLAPYSNFPSAQGTKGVDPTTTESNNKRTSPDIIAPGSAIYSTYINDSYKFLDGTSMATPYVAGLAAIYKLHVAQSSETAANSQAQFRELLQDSELEVKEEGSETRSYVGQVETAYFMAKMKELLGGGAASQPQPLQAVDDPSSGADSSGEAPNLLSLLCGA